MDIKEKGEKFLNKRERQYFTFPIKTEKESIRTTLRTTGYLGRRKISDSFWWCVPLPSGGYGTTTNFCWETFFA